MCESINEKRLKLFVAGQHSSDPDEWSDLVPEYRLLLAETETDAKAMIDFTNVVTEVRMDKPAVLK